MSDRTDFRWPGPWTLIGTMMVAGCGGSPPPAVSVPPADVAATPTACLVTPDQPPSSLVRIGVTHLPLGRDFSTEGGRLVDRQLYRPLVYLDCEGRLVAGLALRWRVTDDSTIWTFELDTARISRTDLSDATQWVPDEQWVSIASASDISIGRPPTADRLSLVFRAPVGVPAVVTDPELAVVGEASNGWPRESGPFQIRYADSSRIDLVGRTGATLVLRFVRVPPAMDPRDALESIGNPPEPLDVLITRDRATVTYARSHRRLRAIPLAWDRAYVLVGSGGSGIAAPPAGVLADLASSAVRAEARVPFGPYWWERDGRCGAMAPPVSGRSGVVGYPRHDAVARALAERIVSLALAGAESSWLGDLVSDPSERPPRVLALDPDGLATALDRGDAQAIVASLPTIPTAGCPSGLVLSRGRRAVTLLESRAYVVVRPNVPAFVLDADGSVRFLPLAP